MDVYSAVKDGADNTKIESILKGSGILDEGFVYWSTPAYLAASKMIVKKDEKNWVVKSTIPYPGNVATRSTF